MQVLPAFFKAWGTYIFTWMGSFYGKSGVYLKNTTPRQGLEADPESSTPDHLVSQFKFGQKRNSNWQKTRLKFCLHKLNTKNA